VEPIIEFRLLSSRNFAVASALFFVFGFGLFGSTTLIPQILQSLYGYRATDAGLVLGPGALVITFFAPIAAQLIQRQIVPARVFLTISIMTVGAAMWYYSTFTLATDYSHYALARAYQGLGYGFFFVPVNVLAYSQLRPDQNNRASSLTNLFRNWGGSFGIAFITTATERRHQFHQTNLGSDIGATSQQLGNRITALTNYLVTKGFSGPDAATAAQGISAPAVLASSESFVLHGLLPCHRVADIGRSPSAVVCPAFQASRKGARISLRTMRYLAPAGH
jgi:DHA2 family multidrug resistance protein